MNEVVIASAVRTAIGAFGGSLKEFTPTDLGVATAKAAIAKAGIAADDIDQAFYGNVIHTEPADMYVARTIALGAGVGVRAPAVTVNRLCGSGLQALVSAFQSLTLGDADMALAGGTECMSRAGYLLPSLRWGRKMGDANMIDMMTAVLTDPFGNGHMGETAENVAEKYSISREEQDAFAVESHRRAAKATKAGLFEEQIVPLAIRGRENDALFKTDEHIRLNASLSDMAKLRPVFRKNGRVTAGNASGINDGASSLVMMTAEAAEKRGVNPMARIVSYGHSGVQPALMGIGPVSAMQIALKKAGLAVDDLDVIESNEAFAAQACAVARELGLDPVKVNPNGGAVAMGHPIGASGAIITTKLLHELLRIGGRYGAATMCIGGGQGVALIVENIQAGR
ncbi:beta-ketothiolase BktB [Oceanicola sp. S124]|uniref:beta-ketothiolase BktB n=1 Tax=Oceanicola sp. S124 TaxID=1042378 RepID=UPI0002E363F8|nr:beta-ketothiolase BktB [Oceanicola sp. S124]